MTRPLRIQYPGAYYHVTCRGNERRKIFRDDQDRKGFLGRLALLLEIYGVSLLCCVLMDNHFHLLVMTPKASLTVRCSNCQDQRFDPIFNAIFTAQLKRSLEG